MKRKGNEKRRKDRSWLDDEEARGEFWHDAWRVRGCRRPAGAEGGEESVFGLSPRENVSDCQRKREREESKEKREQR